MLNTPFDAGGEAYTAEVGAPTAGTAVPLGQARFFQGVVIAKSTNTQSVYIGTQASQVAPLAPGEERELSTANLATWYLRTGVNGEGVYLVGGV